MHESLMKCALFKGLTVEKIEELMNRSSCTVTDYVRGDVIAPRDMAYSGLMIILEGAVAGQRVLSTGRTVLTEAFEAPELISPAFLFGGYNRLPIDVVAATDRVKIMVLHRASVFAMMQDNMIVLSNFIDIISNRANLLTKKLFFLSFESLKERTVQFLLDHNADCQPFVIDEKELADYFEVRLDSLERVLQDLLKAGGISMSGSVITVRSPEALKKLVG